MPESGWFGICALKRLRCYRLGHTIVEMSVNLGFHEHEKSAKQPLGTPRGGDH